MGKGRDSLHSRESEMGSGLPKQLVTPADTSSISLAAVQVWSTPLIAGNARLHPPLHRTVGIIANSGLLVERSSNTRGDGGRQCWFYVCECDSAELQPQDLGFIVILLLLILCADFFMCLVEFIFSFESEEIVQYNKMDIHHDKSELSLWMCK